jgi:hypothetical protein
MPLQPALADRRSFWATVGLPGRSFTTTGGDLAATMVAATSAVAAAAAATSGVLLVSRRLAGAIVAGPAPAATAAVGCAGVLLVALADLRRRTGRAGLVEPVAARCGLLLATASLAAPAIDAAGRWQVGGASVVGWAVTLLVVALVGATSFRLPPAGPAAERPRPAHPRRARRHEPATGGSVPAAPGPDVAPQRDCPGRLRQEQQRYELAPDADCMRGRLILVVPAGGKTAHGHVGFCPAFAETPRIRVTTDYDGVEAVVAAAEVLPWGVRLECRLAEPAEEPIEIPVDFHAQADA